MSARRAPSQPERTRAAAGEGRDVPLPSKKSLVVRGTIITLTRKCGTSTCKCARGELHATPALSYSVDGVTKMLTFRQGDLPVVRAALDRFHQAQAELERRALDGVRVLREEFASRRVRRVRVGR